MKTKHQIIPFFSLMGIALLLVTPNAGAATVQVLPLSDLGIDQAPYTQSGEIHQKTGGKDGGDGLYEAKWYSNATEVWSTDDPPAQDPSKVSTWITSSPVNGASPLYLVFQNDSLGGGSAGSWTFSKAVNWVTLHYGSKMTAWYFEDGITSFGMEFVEGNLGLSNIRAYSNTPVPLPAAAYLFGSALLGMAGIGYRRNKKQA